MILARLKEVVGNDVCEIFGPTGSGKSKFAFYLAQEALRAGRKVLYVDAERNLKDGELAELKDSYYYAPKITDLDSLFLTREENGQEILPLLCVKYHDREILIVDSIGFPILVHWAGLGFHERMRALVRLINWTGTIKRWCSEGRFALLINQPESQYATMQREEEKRRRRDYSPTEPEPFGDKHLFAVKEILRTRVIKTSPDLTEVLVEAYRSRRYGRGEGLIRLEVGKDLKAKWIAKEELPLFKKEGK